MRNLTFVAFAGLAFTWCICASPAQEKAAQATLRHRPVTLAAPQTAEVHYSADGKRMLLMTQFTSKSQPVGGPKLGGKGKAGTTALPRYDTMITVHDTTTGQEFFPPILQTGLSSPFATATLQPVVALSPNGKVFLTTASRTVRFYDAETGKALASSVDLTTNIGHAVFSKDSRRMLTSPISSTTTFDGAGGGFGGKAVKGGGEAQLWEVETGKKLGDTKGAMAPPAKGGGFRTTTTMGKAVFAPDEKSFVTVSSVATKGIQFWDPANMQTVGEPIAVKADTLTFASDGKTFMVSSKDAARAPSEISLWDAATRKQIGQALTTVVRDDVTAAQYRAFIMHADGKTVLMCDGTQAQFWDMNGERPAKKHTFDHPTLVYGLAVSTDGKKAATACGTFGRLGQVFVWDLVSGERLLEIPHDGMIKAMEFAPDGHSLTTVNDRDLRVWNIEGKK